MPSAATLCSPDLPAQLEQLVARAGLPARLVKVELTEDEPVKDWLALSSVLNLLRVRGFELAMDDFGAGIASMRLFSAMPFTELKIDRDFIVHMHREPASRAVAAAIEMGRALGRRVIAEGVEQERDILLLRELGCELAQGFGISPPLAPDARRVPAPALRPAPGPGIKDRTPRYCRGSRSRTSARSRATCRAPVPSSRPACRRPRA